MTASAQPMLHSPALPSGGRIAYRVTGDGQPLVQVHGLGTGHKNYDLLTPHLSPSLRAIDLDLPGYGESDAGDGQRNVEAWADAVAEFIESLELGPVPVHGTSMGGCVSLALAARHPQLVSRLVISCSFARHDNAAGKLWRTWRTAAAAGSAALAELTAVQGFSREFWDRPEADETLDAFVAAMATTSPDEFLRDLGALEHADLGDVIGGIAAPTLLIAADQDVMCPLQAAPSGIGMTDLERLMPDARLHVLERCGHFVSIEQPRETAAAIVAHVLG